MNPVLNLILITLILIELGVRTFAFSRFINTFLILGATNSIVPIVPALLPAFAFAVLPYFLIFVLLILKKRISYPIAIIYSVFIIFSSFTSYRNDPSKFLSIRTLLIESLIILLSATILVMNRSSKEK